MKNKKLIIIISFFLVFISANGQSGLYMRTIYWGNQLEISWLYFTPDKKVIRNPKFGVNPVLLQKEIAENNKNVASYSLSGNKMNVKWGDGIVQTVNVEFKNGVLSAFDGGLCTKPASFPIKYFQDKTYSGLATYGNVTRTVTLFLGKDGKFRDERIGAVSGSGNFTGVAASKKNDAGTYIIKGNTITFKYDNGTQWIAVAQPYDLGKEEVIINDQLFKIQ